MEIVIRGHNLPGRMFRNAGVPLHNVHVGLQVRDVPEGLAPADSASVEWRTAVRVRAVDTGSAVADDRFDFTGPAVHGRRGERFLYVTWGDVGIHGGFAMFRRAKLMLDSVDSELIRGALSGGTALIGSIDLTDAYGGPRCARVGEPDLMWSLGPASTSTS